MRNRYRAALLAAAMLCAWRFTARPQDAAVGPVEEFLILIGQRYPLIGVRQQFGLFVVFLSHDDRYTSRPSIPANFTHPPCHPVGIAGVVLPQAEVCVRTNPYPLPLWVSAAGPFHYGSPRPDCSRPGS